MTAKVNLIRAMKVCAARNANRSEGTTAETTPETSHGRTTVRLNRRSGGP